MFARPRLHASIALAVAAVTSIAVAQLLPATGQAPPVPQGSANTQPAGPDNAPAAEAEAPAPEAARLGREQIDPLLAPVALYPDALLSQVLMASTYPLEVVQANRWLQANKQLQGDALGQALAQLPWDPSVKSLINTPTVLQMMDERLDWTIALGDAFLSQQGDVMDGVQRLRNQAQAAGQLRSDEQMKITAVPATPPPTAVYPEAATAPPVPQYIVIEDTQPDIVYVPVYDPGVAYGTWAYTNNHPFFWRPDNYVPTRGFWYDQRRTGPAWSYAWGRPDWRVRRLELDYDRHAHFNRDLHQDAVVRRIRERDRDDHNHKTHDGRHVWQHNAEHRLGMRYRDDRTARQYTGRTDMTDARRDADGRRQETEDRRTERSEDARTREADRVRERANVNTPRGEVRGGDRTTDRRDDARTQRPTPSAERRPIIPGSVVPNASGRPNGGQSLPGANPPNANGRRDGAQPLPGANPPNVAGRRDGAQPVPGATPPNAVGRPQQVRPDDATARPADRNDRNNDRSNDRGTDRPNRSDSNADRPTPRGNPATPDTAPRPDRAERPAPAAPRGNNAVPSADADAPARPRARGSAPVAPPKSTPERVAPERVTPERATPNVAPERPTPRAAPRPAPSPAPAVERPAPRPAPAPERAAPRPSPAPERAAPERTAPRGAVPDRAAPVDNGRSNDAGGSPRGNGASGDSGGRAGGSRGGSPRGS